MAKEIERKFLVISNEYRSISVEEREIYQGYLSRNPEATVRVRICGDRGYITVKTRNEGAVRNEWEYEIPREEALEMLTNCCPGHIIHKIRYIVPATETGLKWEVDEFLSPRAGLVVAEIELPEADTPFTLPSFIGEEVTGQTEYYNSNL